MVFDIPGSKIVLQKSYFLKGQVVDESKARGLYEAKSSGWKDRRPRGILEVWVVAKAKMSPTAPSPHTLISKDKAVCLLVAPPKD